MSRRSPLVISIVPLAPIARSRRQQQRTWADLVAVTGGAAVCTLKLSTSGFSDVTSNYCAGTTVPLACAAASGGACKITKYYNQVTPGTDDLVMTTLAQMPAITFGGLNGLPIGTGVSANSTNIATGATAYTLAQPFSYSAVAIRTNAASAGGIASNNTVTPNFLFQTANDVRMGAGSNIDETAADNAWHSLQPVFNNTSSAFMVDGTANTALSVGTSAFTSQQLKLFRSTSGTSLDGSIAEFIVYASALSGTDSTALCHNENSATLGYNLGLSC
jgi:hypothetical protein